MKEKLKPTIVLTAICVLVATLLSVINLFTAPRIADRENLKALEALGTVLPGGKNFKKIEIDERYPDTITEAYSADGGFVFRAVGKGGKKGDIVIMVGVDTEGKITGTEIISEGESSGWKEPVYDAVVGTDGKHYTGQTLETLDPFVVSGSSMTSNAFASAIKAALQAYAFASGGSVDIRTPEQILSDNLNAAMGTSGLKFTKLYATEITTGIDNVYSADDDSGYVYVIGEIFVGVNASGSIVTAGISTEISTIVAAAHTAITSGSISMDKEGVLEVYVKGDGNYVIVTNGNGYGITGDKYVRSNKPITVKVCLTPDGTIISTETIEEHETPDYGGNLLSNGEYTDKYNGKNSDTYTDVENVTGVTKTCNGYKAAIERAFEVYELLIQAEGGND